MDYQANTGYPGLENNVQPNQTQPLMHQQSLDANGQPMVMQQQMMGVNGQPMMMQQQPQMVQMMGPNGQPMMVQQQPMMMQQPVMYQQANNSAVGVNCCGCFPIECGIKTLGVFQIIGCVSMLIQVIYQFICMDGYSCNRLAQFGAGPLVPIIYIALFGLMVTGTVFYIQFFCKDTQQTRKRVEIALILSTIVSFISGAMFCATQGSGIIHPWEFQYNNYLIPAIINVLINTGLYVYYIFVAKKFTSLSQTFA